MKRLNKDILSLAVPSILANITVPLVGMADIAVAGHLGAAASSPASGSAAALIGGITIGTMLFDLLYWNFAFLRSGTGGLTAQAYGRLTAVMPGPTPVMPGGSPVMPGSDRASHAVLEIRALLLRALRIAVISGLALIALQWAFLWLAFIFVDCSPEVRELATQYFKIRIWAAPATLSLFAFKGWFIGLQDTVRPMIAELLVNGLNIALSFGLGFGLCGLPHMGFAGVALGTVIAQWCGFTYAAIAARRRVASLMDPTGNVAPQFDKGKPDAQKQPFSCTQITSRSSQSTKSAIFVQPDDPGTSTADHVSSFTSDLAQSKGTTTTLEPQSPVQVQSTESDLAQESATTPSFFHLNRDLVLRSVGMISIYIGFTVISARYGDTLLAVSAILMKLLLVFSYFTDGFAYAGEALTGRFIGAQDYDGVHATIRGTFLWGAVVTALFMLVYGFGGTPLLHLMTSDAGVIEAGRQFLPWLLLMPLIGVPAFLWDGILIGATATSDLRNSVLWSAAGFFGFWFIGLALLPLFTGTPLTNTAAIHLLLAAYFVHLAIRSLYLTLRSRKILG